MKQRERDIDFMERVAAAYQTPGTALSGSLRAVAQKFGVTRTKVRKILITLGAMESPLPDELVALRDQGLSVTEIAERLGLSVATVSTYMPYATVMYKGVERSASACRQESFRARLSSIAEKQIHNEATIKPQETSEMKRTQKTTKVMRLGLELQGVGKEEMAVLRRYCDVKSGYSREILAPAEMTLHALHYAIMGLFGWLNGHLHCFTLPPKTLESLTKGRFGEYLKLAGLYFRSPSDIDGQDIFWDDDYNGEASFKTWLRRKYTAPFRFLGKDEQFMAARKATNDFIKRTRTLQVMPSFDEMQANSGNAPLSVKPLEEVTLGEARRTFALVVGELSERLTLEELLSERPATPEAVWKLCQETTALYERNMKVLEEMRRGTGVVGKMAAEMAMHTMNPKALPLCDSLGYEFDFGDGWEIVISLRGVYDVENLDALDGNLAAQIGQVVKSGRPLCVAMDGSLPLVQDVGGVGGYCDFLTTINGTDAEAKRDMLEWARGLGWTGRRSTPEKLL